MPRKGEGRTGDTISYSTGDTKNERGEELSFPEHDSSGDAGVRDLLDGAKAPKLSMPKPRAEKPKAERKLLSLEDDKLGEYAESEDKVGSFSQADILAHHAQMERNNDYPSDNYNPAVGIDVVEAPATPDQKTVEVHQPAMEIDVNEIAKAGEEEVFKASLIADAAASQAEAKQRKIAAERAPTKLPKQPKKLTLGERVLKFFGR
mgnify:CR=1 FL=1